MTRDDITRMARKAGYGDAMADLHGPALERFAALVVAAERERIIEKNKPEIERINAHIKALEDAVLAEREECAKVCEDMRPTEREFDQRFFIACTLNANAIRARGKV